MRRWVLTVLVALLVLVDVAPAFAQPDERIHLAQQQRRRTLFDILFGEEEAARQPPPAQQQQRQPRRTQPRQQAAPAPTPPPKPEIEKAEDATRLAVFGDSLAMI